jgi:hypothetical protein
MQCNLGSSTAVEFALFSAVFLLMVVPARAQDGIGPEAVSTRVDPCVPIDVDRFKHLLSIELGTAMDPSAAAKAPHHVAMVSLTCVAEGVQLLLEDAVTRKSVTRVIDLERVMPQSRTRLMAVTVSELVLASWLELQLFVPETLEPAGPAPPEEVQRSAARRVEHSLPSHDEAWQLNAGLELMVFASAPRMVPGVGLRVLGPLSSALAMSASADLGWGTLPGSFGQQGRDAALLRLTTASLQLCLLYVGRVSHLDLSIGGGARMGIAHLVGTSRGDTSLEPNSSFAPWGGPQLLLGIAYRAGPHLRLVANLEAGVLTLRIRAQTPSGSTSTPSKVADLDGVWSIASLGVGWAF